MKAVIILSLVVVVRCQISTEQPKYTGSTPSSISCPHSYCNGKYDGTYEMVRYKHHFLQCNGGMASCQACWPASLKYSERCNQCMYNYDDDCYTTTQWQPATTFQCPDLCPDMGPSYTGNIRDPLNAYHYMACWQGITAGCVSCPAGLMFNEEYNACLYEGKYWTESNYSGYEYSKK